MRNERGHRGGFLHGGAQHSGRGEIVVRCAVDETPDGQQVTVTILYAGPQANPLLEQTGVQQDALAFIQRSMDTVSYRYQDGRNEISLQKRAE